MLHAAKGCDVLINGEEVEGVEPDLMIFVPPKSKLVVKNNSRHASAVMKIQVTVCDQPEAPAQEQKPVAVDAK